MHDSIAAAQIATDSPSSQSEIDAEERVVSTHVLVTEEQLEKLRILSRRTRVAQSEYLREAVEDLLSKYQSRQ